MYTDFSAHYLYFLIQIIFATIIMRNRLLDGWAPVIMVISQLLLVEATISEYEIGI